MSTTKTSQQRPNARHVLLLGANHIPYDRGATAYAKEACRARMHSSSPPALASWSVRVIDASASMRSESKASPSVHVGNVEWLKCL